MRHETRSTKRLFPLTSAGIGYNLVAMILLLLGHVRGELAAGLAGLLLLSYSLFSLILCLVSVAVWSSARVQLVSNQNGAFTLSVSKHPRPVLSLLGGTRLYIRYLRVNFPGIQAYFDLSVPVSGEHSQHASPFPGQGLYVPVQQALVIHDFASFYQIPLYTPARNCCEPITIPVIPETPATRRTPAGATAQTTGTSTFTRSENLYETRTYLPGDDPRKINWKIYAHSGALAIREGELLPPPAAEFFCVFNMKTPVVPDAQLQNSFLSLARRAAAYLLELLSRSTAITIVLRNSRGVLEPFRIDGTNPQRETLLVQTLALLALSPAAPASDDCLSLIPPDASLLLFSLPEPGPEKLSRYRTSYFFGPYPVTPEAESFRDRIKPFILLPRTPEFVQKPFRPSEFHAVLARFSAEGVNAYIL